ncbi:MAG: CHASE domain-containing protein [Pseudomonadota bacterium]
MTGPHAPGRIAWLVLAAGLLPALFVWHTLREQATEHARGQFDLQAREILGAIEQRLYQHEQILLGGAGLFDAGGEVSRAAWHAYVARLRLKVNHPGIQGVGFSTLIRPHELEAHIAAMRAAGFPDYTVKPAGRRELYTSIVYLEPFAGRNLAAFGYDMFSEATRRKAMNRAVDRATTAITGKVKLLQETHGRPQAGFLMYVPVYRPGLPLATVAERWRALRGFVYSPYRMDDLMRGILGERNSSIDFVIHAGSGIETAQPMHDSREARPLPAGFQPRFTSSKRISAYGESWVVGLASRPEFEAQFSSQREWLILALGIGISLSLFGLTASLSTRHARARALADEMTAQIRENEARLSGLNERFELAADAAGIGVWEFDLETGRLHWDAQMHRIYQMEPGEFTGYYESWRARLHADDIDAIAALQAASKRGDAPFDTIFRIVWKNGEIRHIRAYAKVLRDAAGHPSRMIGVNYDVTEQQLAETQLRESEQRLRYMLESSPTAARIARAGGHEVIFANHRYAELINQEAPEVQGIDPASYYADAEDYADIVRRIGAGERIFDRLIELDIPGAGRKWTLASYLPIEYEGQPAVLGWFYDITELKRAEQAIVDQASHTQAILENTVDGIITIDARGIVASFNKAAASIFGYAPEEVVGRNVKMLMPEPYQSEHDGYLDRYMATGVARIIGIGREVAGRRKDGETFPMELAVSAIRHEDRPLFIGMVRDITERKRVERMQNEFVSTVSHELRTPLTAISGALGLIAGGALGQLPGQARQMIEIAHKNSQRLTLLINDLLDMEKITAGKMHFDLRAQPLMPLVLQALEANQAYGAERRIGLALAGEPLDARVRVDAQRLMQVLSNLISNAIKFSREDGVVELSVARLGDTVRVTVSDHGTGIPEAFRSRIFQKFAQADASDTRQKGGTGLGLAITRELVQRMGGRIGFDSVEGEGSRFHFDLPIVEDDAEPPAACDDAH